MKTKTQNTKPKGSTTSISGFFFLVLVLGIESLPYNDTVVQAETRDLPFKLEDTTYGIKNSNIKAKN